MNKEFSALRESTLDHRPRKPRIVVSPLALEVPDSRRESFAGFDRTRESELENYQIALVPFQTINGHVDGASTPSGKSQLLLLPFTWKELVTYVRRKKHSISEGADDLAQFSQVSVNFSSMDVHRSGQSVSLSALEFKVLRFFVSNPNRVISRDELLDQVWGFDNYPSTRTVDNLVLKLLCPLAFARQRTFRELVQPATCSEHVEKKLRKKAKFPFHHEWIANSVSEFSGRTLHQ